MPLLDRTYISNLYAFSVGDKYLFLERFEESERQLAVEPHRLIQGDIGTHTINVGGAKWEANLSSRVLILSNPYPFVGIFDLLFAAYNDENFLLNSSNFSTIMKSATLDIGEEGVQCSLMCWSDTSPITSWIGVNTGLSNNIKEDFIGRIARFYDTSISFNNDWTFYNPNAMLSSMIVRSANISIDVDVNEHFFIKKSTESHNPYPDFFVQGYNISGDIKFVCPFVNNFYINNLEKFKQHIQGSGFILNVAGYYFDLSYGKMIVNKLTKNVDSNNMVTMCLTFNLSATKNPL